MPNDDLISRDASISLIENFQRELCPVGMYGRHAVYGSDRDKFDDWQFIIDELEKIPAVDAEPVRHGRWVKMTGMLPPEYHGHYECSECQWHMKGIRNSWTREEEMSYCPNCGAKMDDDGDAR